MPRSENHGLERTHIRFDPQELLERPALEFFTVGAQGTFEQSILAQSAAISAACRAVVLLSGESGAIPSVVEFVLTTRIHDLHE